MKIRIHIYLLFLVTITSSILSSCFLDCINGSGKLKIETRKLQSFKSVDLKGGGNLIIVFGEQPSLKIETDENLLENIETKVSGDELIIKLNKCVTHYTKMNMILTVTELEAISISGSGNISSKDTLKGDRFNIEVSGSGNANFYLRCEELETKISGSGTINLMGRANNHESDISGSGDLNAFELITTKTNIDVSGSGTASLYVGNQLNAKVSGSGGVGFKGNPEVKSKITGSGTVFNAE